LDGDDEAGLHERIKSVERGLLVDTVGGWPGPAGVWTAGGHRYMSDGSPWRARSASYDKTGLPELAAGLAAAGVQLVSTGPPPRPSRQPEATGHAGRGRDRFPGAWTAG
jgi:hypothetical protein